MHKNIIPEEYHDYLYRLTYYALSGIAPHVPKSISPNQITVLAFLCAMIGNVLLVFVHTPVAYLYWGGFNFLWFILDALDGMHARLSNQSSEFGGFLDHALDNIYFLFMLTTFAIKFHLAHLLYIYIITLRVTAAVMVFTVQCHTKKLHLARFSGGVEFVLTSTVMVLSYLYPHANPFHWTTNAMVLHWMQALDLQHGVFMKLALLVYFFGVPMAVAQQFMFVRRALHS